MKLRKFLYHPTLEAKIFEGKCIDSAFEEGYMKLDDYRKVINSETIGIKKYDSEKPKTPKKTKQVRKSKRKDWS